MNEQLSTGLRHDSFAAAAQPYSMATASSQRIRAVPGVIEACSSLPRGPVRGCYVAPDSPAQAQVLRRPRQMLPEPLEVGFLPSLRVRLGILAGLHGGQHFQGVGHLAVLPAGGVEDRG